MGRASHGHRVNHIAQEKITAVLAGLGGGKGDGEGSGLPGRQDGRLRRIHGKSTAAFQQSRLYRQRHFTIIDDLDGALSSFPDGNIAKLQVAGD